MSMLCKGDSSWSSPGPVQMGSAGISSGKGNGGRWEELWRSRPLAGVSSCCTEPQEPPVPAEWCPGMNKRQAVTAGLGAFRGYASKQSVFEHVGKTWQEICVPLALVSPPAPTHCWGGTAGSTDTIHFNETSPLRAPVASPLRQSSASSWRGKRMYFLLMG